LSENIFVLSFIGGFDTIKIILSLVRLQNAKLIIAKMKHRTLSTGKKISLGAGDDSVVVLVRGFWGPCVHVWHAYMTTGGYRRSAPRPSPPKKNGTPLT
jgi:hypothetical protein